MGVANAVITNEDTGRLAAAFPGFFDRVLVDAPCSGEGMFRKEPQAVDQHCEGLVRHCAQLAAESLDNAAAMVAPPVPFPPRRTRDRRRPFWPGTRSFLCWTVPGISARRGRKTAAAGCLWT